MKRILAELLRMPQFLLISAVKAYRLLISPALGASCRFTPSCSAYGIEALGQHGALAGSYLTLRRLVRCNPWCDGGHDPVPALQPVSFFSRLLRPSVSNSSEKTPS